MIRKLLMILLALHVFMPVPALAQSYANEEDSIASNFDIEEDRYPFPDYAMYLDPHDAKWRGDCVITHMNWDDSILFPGLLGGSPHDHMFSGNSLSNYASTFSSLRTTGNGSCTGKRLNRSSYWFPVFHKSESVAVIPTGTSLYYATIQPNTVRLPRGLQMIGGRKPGDPDFYDDPPGVVFPPGTPRYDGFRSYQCALSGVQSTDLSVINCAAGDTLVVNIDFPHCWNGTDLTSANGRDHVTYGEYGTNVCPSSHPYPIVSITQKIYYEHDGPSDYENWWLSSDRMSEDPEEWEANGSTIHADYREAWDDEARALFEHFCNGISYGEVTGVGHGCNSPNTGGPYLFENDTVGLSGGEMAAAVRPTDDDNEFNGARLRARLRRR